jgi:hypothetical protein
VSDNTPAIIAGNPWLTSQVNHFILLCNLFRGTKMMTITIADTTGCVLIAKQETPL